MEFSSFLVIRHVNCIALMHLNALLLISPRYSLQLLLWHIFGRGTGVKNHLARSFTFRPRACREVCIFNSVRWKGRRASVSLAYYFQKRCRCSSVSCEFLRSNLPDGQPRRVTGNQETLLPHKHLTLLSPRCRVFFYQCSPCRRPEHVVLRKLGADLWEGDDHFGFILIVWKQAFLGGS